MANKRTIQTNIDAIVRYWAARVDECDLSVDFSEAHERCWRCGYKSRLERCHIVPHSLGGADAPENLVLLCCLCHAEGPNVADPEFFWDWLKAHKATFYDTYWANRGAKEYEFIYKKSLVQEFIDLNITDFNAMSNLMREQMEKASWHWGQPRMNPATVAGIFRLMIRKLQQDDISSTVDLSK